jgi:hypothetical protein
VSSFEIHSVVLNQKKNMKGNQDAHKNLAKFLSDVHPNGDTISHQPVKKWIDTGIKLGTSDSIEVQNMFMRHKFLQKAGRMILCNRIISLLGAWLCGITPCYLGTIMVSPTKTLLLLLRKHYLTYGASKLSEELAPSSAQR